MSKRSLQPKPSPPCPYSYELKNRDGNVCLKAVLGVQYMVTLKKKFYYFNNPQTTRATGYCGNQTAVLSLESNEMYLEFTFVKKSKEYYTHKLRARLGPISVYDNNKCENYSYPETVNNEQLFKTTTGLSFKCKSQLVVKMSPNLRLKIMSAQFQPFDLSNGQFGKDFECWQDYINRIIPIIVGAIAVGILLIATVSYLVVREYRHRNYESM
ncbi:lysosome-associated membrane glycoprotein 2 isoform X2 [Sardina pilchardus]